jgi:hypothetical protein
MFGESIFLKPLQSLRKRNKYSSNLSQNVGLGASDIILNFN